MGGMKKKVQVKREKEGYTLEEMRVLTDRMIDDMVDRLRVRLRSAWKKREEERKRSRHGITV